MRHYWFGRIQHATIQVRNNTFLSSSSSSLARYFVNGQPLDYGHRQVNEVNYVSSQVSVLRHYSANTNASSGQEIIRKYVPRRALMYVPGSDQRKLDKIPSLQADSVLMDCEDGVALNQKDQARILIRKYLEQHKTKFLNKTELGLRVNSVQSGLCSLDLEGVLKSCQHLPASIALPKVETVDHLKWFASECSKWVPNRLDVENKMSLILFVETAQGMLNLPSICDTAWALSRQGAPWVPEGIVFGSDDYCADIGATRTKEASETLYARQFVILVAKAFKLQAIDVVYIDYKDLTGLEKQCLEGSGMGFTGKQLIHPSQVSICQQSFSPSPSKVEWATALVEAFASHQASGKGAFTFRGAMIDMPLLLQAKNILELAKGV